MAFKIKEKDRREIAAAFEAVAETRNKAEDAVRQFNQDMVWALARLQESIEPHNAARQLVRGKIEDVHRELDEEFAKRTERWQTSSAGSEVADWLQQLDEVANDIDDVTVTISELDVDEVLGPDHSVKFNDLEPEP